MSREKAEQEVTTPKRQGKVLHPAVKAAVMSIALLTGAACKKSISVENTPSAQETESQPMRLTPPAIMVDPQVDPNTNLPRYKTVEEVRMSLGRNQNNTKLKSAVANHLVQIIKSIDVEQATYEQIEYVVRMAHALTIMGPRIPNEESHGTREDYFDTQKIFESSLKICNKKYLSNLPAEIKNTPAWRKQFAQL